MSRSTLAYIPLKLFASSLRVVLWLTTWHSPAPDRKFHIQTRDDKRDITIHVYESRATRKQPAPVLLNWHGSAYIVPYHGSDDLFCRRISESTDFTVLDATYALAPEWPFPTGLEDVEDLILYVLSKPDQYDPNNIFLSGFSAGATLALVAASNPKSSIPRERIRGVIAVYPSTDLASPAEDKRGIDGSPGILPPAVVKWSESCYLLPGTDVKDPRVSVLYADPELFPQNILVITAEKDNIAPEAEAFAKKLQASGKNTVLKRYDGVDHDWDKMCKENTKESSLRDDAYKVAADYLTKLQDR